MSKNSTLPKIIRILAIAFLVHCLIGLSGCATSIIKIAKPTPDIIKELNFRTRLSESIYLFFNKKRGYFAMQVATVPHKLAATR